MILNCPRKKPKDRNLWYKWFAWYPVRINKDQCAWLQYVERKEIAKTYATYDDWTRYTYRLQK